MRLLAFLFSIFLFIALFYLTTTDLVPQNRGIRFFLVVLTFICYFLQIDKIELIKKLMIRADKLPAIQTQGSARMLIAFFLTAITVLIGNIKNL